MAAAEEEKPGVKSSSSIVPCFLFVELVIMAGTVLLAYYFEYTDTFPVHIQGFFCYDKTFSKPYPGPEESSKIPPVLVYSLVTAVPAFTILFGELLAFFTRAKGAQEKTIVTADCCYFNPLLRRVIRFLGVYAFGLFTTAIFANAGQVVTGNQTPHFLSACRPNYTALGCQSTMQYVTERRACTGNPLLVLSARRSFPSKDASLSVYAAVYTVMYVTLVFRTKGTRLTKPTVSLTLLCLALLVGVVRVTEYRNHWADVLAGFFTGASIAVFLVTCVINNFQQARPLPLPLRPQRPESVLGMPMVALPCVESPLEKLRGDLRSPRSHDHQPYRFPPATPDVLIPSRSISSEV
ncbi:phospholipid phosphatase-related protein type 2a isoform 1-T1 [Aplochiton taeniatus]